MFGGVKRDVTDCDMDDDYCGSTTWTDGVRVELPPPFRGDGEKPFATWVKQFEAAVRAQPRGFRSRSYTATLGTLLLRDWTAWLSCCGTLYRRMSSVIMSE